MVLVFLFSHEVVHFDFHAVEVVDELGQTCWELLLLLVGFGGSLDPLEGRLRLWALKAASRVCDDDVGE